MSKFLRSTKPHNLHDHKPLFSQLKFFSKIQQTLLTVGHVSLELALSERESRCVVTALLPQAGSGAAARPSEDARDREVCGCDKEGGDLALG